MLVSELWNFCPQWIWRFGGWLIAIKVSRCSLHIFLVILLDCFFTTFSMSRLLLIIHVLIMPEQKTFHFLLPAVNGAAVRIVNLGVPSSYVLDENFCRPLILDCDFEFQANDVGFVLKWYHNNHLIYQWIPPRKPFSFVSPNR